MMSSFADRVIVVAGSASGIGLISKGVMVRTCDRNGKSFENVRNELNLELQSRVCLFVVVCFVFNAVAARAQPPLRQTSRRVCGVEGRRPITITRYSPIVLQVMPEGNYVFKLSLGAAGLPETVLRSSPNRDSASTTLLRPRARRSLVYTPS